MAFHTSQLPQSFNGLNGLNKSFHSLLTSPTLPSRSDPRPGKTAQPGKDTRDAPNYQFWPDAIAIGTLTGTTFTQILGAGCHQGVNPNDRLRRGNSHIAFDFKNEQLVLRADMQLPKDKVPPALAPLDAELSFDDVTSHGFYVTYHRVVGNMFQVVVTVSCRRPPKFYVKFEHGRMDQHAEKKFKQDRRRATAMDFAITDSVSERDAGPINAIPEGACAFPTFWNTYRWTFSLNGQDLHRLLDCTKRIRALADGDPDMNIMANTGNSTRWSVDILSKDASDSIYGQPNLDDIRFSARTLMEGLIAHGLVRPIDLKPLWTALHEVAVVPAFQDRVLESMYSWQERIRDVTVVVRKTASFLRQKKREISDHLVLVRTIQVTPTRLLIGPPQAEPSNSVTRKYADSIDGIIRVQFTDEEDKLYVVNMREIDTLRPDIGIMARVRRALHHGLIIGGRRFLPVASSASQQKDHAIWFIDHKVIDNVALRRWMGDVSETVVAKHFARMGLPFSTSRIVDMKITLGQELKDIQRNGRTFTDGVAMAGLEVLQNAAFALGERKGLNASPSAIQFRLGGAKGVLAHWPDLCQKDEVRLRPSLIKFQSNLSDLNVVRIAKYQVAFLNRQFINIMCANGVPRELVVQIFQEAVADIKGLRERVKSNKMTKGDHQLIGLCSDFPLGQLIKAGFHQNPFVLDIADIIECRALQDLKWRARVKLPGGVFLIGIADETGTLQEGEVFCQFQENEEGSKAKMVVGEVLVCRAPARDVRRVRAVNNPKLKHLKNVVVFNVQGERDLPSMLGGGDLDGDDYTLIWDQRFVRPLNVYEPMDYEAPIPVKVAKVTQTDLNENFVSYILNDILGQVDNNHLALSDQRTPFDPDCLELSEIHSVSCCYHRTGKAASLPARLRPTSWPDFMDKDDNKKTYQSNQVLGEIFRIVQPDPHFSPADIRKLGFPAENRISQYPVYKSLLDRLKPVKAHYEKALQYDMRRYRVFEPEIPTGIAIKNKKRKRARDQNLNEPLRDSYQMLIRDTRAMAMEQVQNIEFRTRLSPELMVARHAYALTYEKEYVQDWEKELSAGQWHAAPRGPDDEQVEEDMKPKPLISFAWVFWSELIQLAGMAGVKAEDEVPRDL
uniref:RNA-dependent RNA polymerase n=1 Tax=Kwoniella pini CBS 10737 TaxID=1296096 RepID=A0A1B9I4A8_9TREE|nr:RNA-dependent RNA polymerase 1 [Kwoniella pini CBS 10737]OCF50343.1 RNA-dependent RNA polymerase 1 [Kwoniella pini CBS 10737]